MADRDNNGRFVKGSKAAGRPKGAKSKFTTLKAAFVEAFDEGGKEALAKLRDTDPKAFFEIFRALYPSEVKSTVKQDANITYESAGLSESLALAEEAAAAPNARPLPKSGTD